MSFLRSMVTMIFSGHTPAQKLNYIKFLTSRRTEVLAYDPVTISIVATNRCTLSCDMCPTHSGIVPKEYEHAQKNVKDIEFGMFKKLIDRFKNAVAVHIIGSGEPLLNKDFFKMVDYAASKSMVVKTFSNGTTIEKNMDNLLNSKLDGITISLNGHNSSEFARMTGEDEDVYKKIYEAVKKLVHERKKRRSRLKIKLSFIIDKFNWRFIPDMIRTAVDLGVDHVFLCNFLPAPYESLKAQERVLTPHEGVIRELGALFAGLEPAIRKKITPPVLVDTKKNLNSCETHFTQIRFDGDGNVSSCSMMLLDMTGHGNYKDEDVWNNDFFKGMRRAFLKGSTQDLPSPCRVCPDNKGVKIRI